MNSKDWTLIGFVVIAIGFATAIREYADVRNRIEITQSKLDVVADETAKTIRDLHSALNDLRKAFRDQEAKSHPVAVDPPKTSDPPKKAIVPTIVMHTDGNCGICNHWWTHDRPNWERSGWTVDKITDLAGNRSFAR